MTDTKHLAIVLIEGFADWEYGLLAAASAQWFGITVSILTPGGAHVTSMAGLKAIGHGALETADPNTFDAIAVIGSDRWEKGEAPDVSGMVSAIDNSNGVIGAICGGTLALAKAGLLAGRSHTSNGPQWLSDHAGQYPGNELYRDVPYAVADRRVVTAPGTAPDTFAAAMLEALLPDQHEQVAGALAMLAAEHKGPQNDAPR